MGADKGGDEDLVFQTESRQLWQLEVTFNENVLIGQSDTLHDDRLAFRQLRQLLPISRRLVFFRGHGCSLAPQNLIYINNINM
jgi:hypothetical protein